MSRSIFAGISRAPVERARRFPCENCGSPLAFSPGDDALKCPSCGHVNPIPAHDSAIEEQDFGAALEKLKQAAVLEEVASVKCTSCAADFSMPEGVHAQDCPFCGTPVVADTGVNRRIKPHAVAPFSIDDRTARQGFKTWLAGRWFAPNDLTAYARQEERLKGVYVPFWTFDCGTESVYQGQRGKAIRRKRRVMVTIKGKRKSVMRSHTEMRWTRVSGRVSRFFDDVLVLASTSLPPRMTEQLMPWLLSDLVVYEEAYLSGFISEAYTLDLEIGFSDACRLMDGVIRDDVARDIGGDGQRIDRVDTKRDDIRFKHVLLPIWMATYRYGHKPYRFIINGQTGAVVGERPYSAWKIAYASFAASVAIAVGLLAAYAVKAG